MINTKLELKFTAKIVNDEDVYNPEHLMRAFMQIIAQFSSEQVTTSDGSMSDYRSNMRIKEIIHECADNGLFRVDGAITKDNDALIYEPLQAIGVSIEGDIHNCYLDAPVYENTYKCRSLDELQEILDDDIANSSHYEMGIDLDMSEIYEFDVSDYRDQFEQFSVINSRQRQELIDSWTCEPTYNGDGSFTAAGNGLIKR